MAVLLIAEPGVDHTAGGVVHRQQQREWRAVFAQAPVITGVRLDQHAVPRHALATYPVLGRTPSPRTAHSGLREEASQGGPANVDSFPFPQQLVEMGVVGSHASGLGQVRHVGDHCLGCGIGWLAARVAVGQGGGSALLVSRQHGSCVPWARTHQLGRLIRRILLSQQTVQNL